MDLQFVLRVIALLFLFAIIAIITKVIMIIAGRIGKEFGFGDMLIKFGGKLRQILRK